MYSSSSVAIITFVDITKFILIRTKHDQESPTPLNKILGHGLLEVASVVIPASLLVFEYINQYRTQLDVKGFCSMLSDGNKLQVQDNFWKRDNMAVLV